MRVVFFAALMVVLYAITVFAQSPSPGFPHNEFMKFKIGKPVMSGLSDSLNTGKLNVPFNTKNLYFNDSKDKELRIGNPVEGNHTIQRGITIVKPKGSFPMPVYKPDSTIRFSLLIKEYKKFPSHDIR